MNQISIIFPNQLFRLNPLFNCKCDILLIEDSLFFGNDKFHKYVNHKNKIVLLKAAMQSYKKFILDKGLRVIYLENKSRYSTIDYLREYLKDKYQILNVINPHDYLIKKRLNNLCKEFNIKIKFFESPMFLTSNEIRDAFNKNSKKPLMARFYKRQRKNQKILVNPDYSPVGGKWSFDEFNRKKLPKKISIPGLYKLPKNKFVLSAEKIIKDEKIEYRGIGDSFFYPTTFEEADQWLKNFFEIKLSLFGDYEDSISKENQFLWHSLLSPIMNIGLITPKEIINKAITFSTQNHIPLNCLEGFIRQIIGWR